MTIQELLLLVHRMRQSQIEYFHTRSSEALANSKMLEKEVDEIIARGINYYNRMEMLEAAAKKFEEKGFTRQLPEKKMRD